MRIVAAENSDSTGAARREATGVDPAGVLLAETDLLRKVIAGMGLRAGDADDVLQAVSVKCLSHAVAFADRPQCRRWLIRVTMNECITEHRRRRRFRRHAAVLSKHRSASTAKDPVRSAVSSEELEAVQDALRGLDDALLRPLVLKYFCRLRSAEIGEILNLPAPTVRSALCKGRLALAKALMKRGIEP